MCLLQLCLLELVPSRMVWIQKEVAQREHISEKWHSASSLVNPMLRVPRVLTLLVLSPSLEFLLLFLLCVASDQKKVFPAPFSACLKTGNGF